MEKGYLLIVLHAHLPFVRHPEHESFLEENWLYEAITETYVPLLDIFERLVRDGVGFRITISLSPTLAEMLSDPLLQERYVSHIDRLIELSEKEVHRTRDQPEFHETALMYRDRFHAARNTFINKYGMNLVRGFRGFQDIGRVEIVACPATHGYLPLMEPVPKAARAQIVIGAENYIKHFGRRPGGMWLSECGYYSGVENVLKEAGIRYFFAESHGVINAVPRPPFGVYAPVYCQSGVAAFGRDQESSRQVWSTEEGYPGDPEYRDFYRDIGFDLPVEYLSLYIHEKRTRIQTGIKYYRITGRDAVIKESYNFRAARERAAEHAGNFLFNRRRQVEHLYGLMGGRRPVIVSPYDAELFGHWWFEGPEFLDFLIRKIWYDQEVLQMVTATDYLDIYPENRTADLSISSWGQDGYSGVWLEPSNDWIYRHLHKASEGMSALAERFPDADGFMKRALNQAARELLLAQSSDWAFIMKTGTMVEYAVKRTESHLHRFNRLHEEIISGKVDYKFLIELESMDNLFGEMDYRVYK